VYSLALPPVGCEVLGVRCHEGVYYWKGVMDLAPPDIWNAVSRESALSWESMGVAASTRTPSPSEDESEDEPSRS
jgi:hypothetical protein